MSIVAVDQIAASRRAFGLWAEVYDGQQSPLLSLEERFLSGLLPDVRGLDVVDAGCGTGRWLKRLAVQSPRSLIGVDASPEMLERAAVHLGGNADLRLGDCARLPVEDGSADLIVASFVASYVPSLEMFVAELERICRPDGSVFLSDMHPATAHARKWKRAFRAHGEVVELATQNRPTENVLSSFHAFGFEMLSLVEPAFGAEEKEIFERNGRLRAFHESAGLPAVYILQLRKARARSSRSSAVPIDSPSSIALMGARCAIGPGESIDAPIFIDSGRIRRIGDCPLAHRERNTSRQNAIDCSNTMILPGLINAHDHLEFGLFPNLGHGPYRNSAQWALDIHRTDAAAIERHRSVPKDVRLWWGAIRNLLCGVTTVCHHNPVTAHLLAPDFPVRVPTRFGWAHSLSLDPEISSRFGATPGDFPFILHAAEGTDRRSAADVAELDRMGALDDRTVLVHGLALDRRAVAQLNRRGASLVICPTSNRFLFGHAPSRELLASVTNLALGTDSCLTGAGDLLDEIRFAHGEMDLDTRDLYNMTTAWPSRIFRLRRGEGCLRPGSAADVICVRDTGASPADTLANLHFSHVELVLLGGRVQLASPAVFGRLPATLRAGLQALEVDGEIRWIRAPLDRLFAAAEQVLGRDIRIGGKRVRYAHSS